MDKDMKKSRKNGSGIYRLLFVLFLLIFLVTASVSVKRYLNRKEAERRYAALHSQAAAVEESSKAESVPEDSSEAESVPAESSAAESAETESGDTEFITNENVSIPARNIDWAALKAENEDVYAWLYVPGTLVDYPVLQHPDEADYYLDRNMDLTEGFPGCLYTDYYNAKDFTDPNTVIYGHNMYDNLMFTTLHWYEGREFFEAYPYFYIYTPEGNFAYKIFAAYKGSNLHQILSYSYASDYAIQMYFDQIWTYRDVGNHFRYDVELTPKSRIVTLSTCVDQDHGHRYLVQGVLLNEEPAA